MPAWMWIPICAGGAALLGVLLWILIKLGVRVQEVRVGKTTIVVHGEAHDPDTPLGRALDNVPLHISDLAAMLAGRYYRLMKAHGIDERYITELQDSWDAARLLTIAVTRGNGSNSAQKILEAEIVRQVWCGRDLRTYVEESVVPRILGTIRDTINAHYDSAVLITPGQHRDREISQVEWYNDLVSDECRREIAEHIVPYFEFAAECLRHGCKE